MITFNRFTDLLKRFRDFSLEHANHFNSLIYELNDLTKYLIILRYRELFQKKRFSYREDRGLDFIRDSADHFQRPYLRCVRRASMAFRFRVHVSRECARECTAASI